MSAPHPDAAAPAGLAIESRDQHTQSQPAVSWQKQKRPAVRTEKYEVKEVIQSLLITDRSHDTNIRSYEQK